MRIAILGDYDPAMHTHRPMLGSIDGALWVKTTAIDAAMLSTIDGLWLAPGSPYADFDRVMEAIRFARERRLPFLGTCGGFQHALIEYARNVMAWRDADSVEHGTATAHPVIVPIGCRLDGEHEVRVRPGTRLAAVCGEGARSETYFCSYQADASLERQFEQAGMRISAHAAEDGSPRACELAEHPFFVATAFQPQMKAGHPLITAFAQAARQHALRRAWAGSVTPADYEQHMTNTGQAAANAALSAELLTGVTGRLWMAGAGPGQMFEHGLSLDAFDVTFTDIRAEFLARLRERLPQAQTLVDDIEDTRLTPGFDAALVVLVLEHVDWRKAVASLARVAREWLIVIQRNPAGMATAVTPGVTPPGTMAVFASESRPHLVDEMEFALEAARYGYQVVRRVERPVRDGKAMIGLHVRRT